MESIATHLAGIIGRLHNAISTHLRRDSTRALILTLVYSRINRVSQRFARLFARFQAGTLPKPRATRPGRSRAPREKTPHIPTKRGWLVHTVGYQAANHASQLRHLLARPEMAEFLAAAPQAGRLLRPLCRLLGTELPPSLALPPRPPRIRRPRAPKPPRPRLHHGKYTPAQLRNYSPGKIPAFSKRPP